ncbi:MAG: hypothetical protein AABX82_02750 [Nanoarchaeota archaeon]
MVIQFIKQTLGLSNPFEDFTSNVTRTTSILYGMQSDAKAVHFKRVKEKGEAIKRIVGLPIASNNQCLIKLIEKKHAKIAALPHSGERIQLETMERDMSKALHFFIEYVLEVTAIARELDKHQQKQSNPLLLTKIRNALHFAEKMRARCHIQVQAYKKAPRTKQ